MQTDASQCKQDQHVDHGRAVAADGGLYLLLKDSVGDATENSAIPGHQCTAAMPPVQQQSAYVLLWHVGQLLAEYDFKTNQPAVSRYQLVA